MNLLPSRLFILVFTLCLVGCDDANLLQLDRQQNLTSATGQDAAANQVPTGMLTGSVSEQHDVIARSFNNIDKRTVPETVPSDTQSRPRPSPPPRFDPNDQRPPLLAITTEDSTTLGVPIGLFSDQTVLMKNDGAIEFLNNSLVLKQSILSERFQPISVNELRQQLNAEFGRRYTVKSESPYLIVAQPQHSLVWTQRFRNIVHSFQLYCTTHAIERRPIEFPLVAVVFGTHAEFLRYAHTEGAQLPTNCVGYYSQKSNRIVLFESETGETRETFYTISHEATHQLAFNSGLHQRLASTPLWLLEGFATMFEAPTLSGLNARDGNSAWPESRRQTWLEMKQKPDSIAIMIDQMIRSDKPFADLPQESYTLAWAMVTYLSQRRSQQFGKYLAMAANRPPYEDYSFAQRFSDFHSIFGSDPRMIGRELIKFVEQIR